MQLLFARYLRMYLLVFVVSCPTGVFAQADTSVTTVSNEPLERTLVTRFFQQQAKVRYIYSTTMNADATAIAWSADGPDGSQVIHVASLPETDKALRISAIISPKEWCYETDPQWSPDGREIAFLSDARSPGQVQLFIANAATGGLITDQPLTQFDGHVAHLKWSPDGKYLSVLYVEKATREPSPMAAQNRAVGVIDSALNKDVQRIAIIERLTGNTQLVTPSIFYIFEYDWSPDSKQFAYVAAPPPGDDNWYIARLYKQSMSTPDTALLYKPLRQIAVPRWSPDGKRIAFIEGLMSDQGGTGGEIFVLALSGGKPQNLTPGRLSTPSWFLWRTNDSILFTEFTGGSVAINTLNPANRSVTKLWKAGESIRAGSEEMSLSVVSDKNEPILAFIRTSWNRLPEVFWGTINKLKQVTNLNTSMHQAGPKAENVEWVNEGKQIQGWLLYPEAYDSLKKYPMLVCVHGGPAWITTPTWSAPDFNTTVYPRLGYFVFFPNPRGSLGQGEAFTLANRRDWGFGDLRDIITGVDVVIKKFSVDNRRIGILGWSYGGSMAMMAVTQTNRFRAAVAGAGAADWLSYYGQNAIDKWMLSYFGSSPYDDPSSYAKCSAMTYIKKAKTPTLVLVGERDGEAPPPQSFQFWHALKELQVPTQLKVYADEGHSFEKFEDMIDISVRTIEWFNKYMAPE